MEYYIFKNMNISNETIHDKLAGLFKAIGSATRLEILLAIGNGEACVCHLENALGKRQAYISQHLMAMREEGIVTTRREGRYIFYSLVNAQILDLIKLAGVVDDIDGVNLIQMEAPDCVPNCPCPHCKSDGE